MKETGKPFILGAECDALSSPSCRDTAPTKVDAMLRVAALQMANPRACDTNDV